MSDAADLYARGLTALETNDPHEAVECFTRLVAARPAVAAGYRGRAHAYLMLNDRPRALADFNLAVRYAPDDPQLLAERAAERLKQRDYAGTISDCETVLKLDPGRVDVLAIRGHAHARNGDSTAALADFAAALAGDPEGAAEYRTARGRLWLGLGQFADAEADADAALMSNPDHTPALELRALARQDLGRLDEAADDFAAACAVERPSVGALTGAALVAISLQRWDEAERAADRLGATGLELRATARHGRGDFAGAVADLTEVLIRQPHKAAARMRRAAAFTAAGDAPAAVRDYLAVLDRDPDDAGALNAVAWLWATAPAVTDSAKAVAFATRACELTDWSTAGHLDTLAAAHAAAGEWDAAVAWQQKAVEVGGGEYRAKRDEYRTR